MRLEKADDGAEQCRLAHPMPKVICPDSGQVQEPPGAPFVSQRRRKGREGEGMGVVWRLGRHGLRS